MRYSFILLTVLLFSCSHLVYVVRHAEKDTHHTNMASDTPLSGAGTQRAVALKNILRYKKIKTIYATNTIRAKSTAQPTADYFALPITMYGSRPDSNFIGQLKVANKNVLVVGHSNTVDDLVNMLCGKKIIDGDLPDTLYGNLYEIKMVGKKTKLNTRNYGQPLQ